MTSRSEAPHRHYVNEKFGEMARILATHPDRIKDRLSAAWSAEGANITRPHWLEGITGELRDRIDNVADRLQTLRTDPDSITEKDAQGIAGQILSLSYDLDRYTD